MSAARKHLSERMGKLRLCDPTLRRTLACGFYRGYDVARADRRARQRPWKKSHASLGFPANRYWRLGTRWHNVIKSVRRVLFAPTVFFTSVAYQRNELSSDTREIDTMATDFLWTPNYVGAIPLGEPDTMATDFLWTPNGVRAIGLGDPDTMATEFLWVAKQVS